jgi:hypothetical protein
VLARKGRRRPQSWVSVGLGALLWLRVEEPASAQFVNNVCGSMQGTLCTVNPAPIGSPCACFTPSGPSPGQIITPNAPPMSKSFQSTNNTCRTLRGICQTYPAPIGSPCVCFGDPGTVISR